MVTKKVSIILIGCVIVLLTGCGKMGTIELQGVTYNKSEFSDNALSWIAMYNSLSEDEKSSLTDACKIMVLRGYDVHLVLGEVSNIKITHPADLRIAEALVGDNNAE